MEKLKGLKDFASFSSKKVLVRVDFNVPVSEGKVTDDFRIKKTLPTIKFLLENNAKVILLSHLADKDKKALSLKPIFEYLKDIIPLSFAEDFESLESKVASLNNGEAVLFENLRFDEGEKENSKEFAQKISSLGDVYVNEAFSVSHREHASVVGLPKFLPGFAGFLFEEEINNLSKAFSPEHPFLFVLGGAKTSTKLPLLQKFSSLADKIFIGGVLANDFFKTKGLEVGNSFVSDDFDSKSEVLKEQKIILPEKVLVSGQNGEQFVKTTESLNKEDSIKDVVVKNSSELEKIINESKFILWNGPMGNLEEDFGGGTRDLALLITRSSAKTIVGGGDTLSVFPGAVLEKFSFVSTGGGAMLDFLANETLPGIEALKQ